MTSFCNSYIENFGCIALLCIRSFYCTYTRYNFYDKLSQNYVIFQVFDICIRTYIPEQMDAIARYFVQLFLQRKRERWGGGA
jgi:hypothetical protein